MTETTRLETEAWQAALEEGKKSLDRGDHLGAALQLAEAASQDSSGQGAGLLGLALFRAERYAEAQHYLGQALAADPGNTDWEYLSTLALLNAEAEVNVFVPPVQFHDAERLLGPPEDPKLPTPGSPQRPSLVSRMHVAVGKAIGQMGGGVFDTLTAKAGKNYLDGVWTNWYRKGLYRGILTLASMREKLNTDNLRSTYPPGAKVGFQREDLEAPEGVSYFRTADGSWNNLDNPKEGAAGTRFPRNVENKVIRPANNAELLSPNPREVSRKLLARGDEMKEVPFLNMLAAAWIQFQNHDWISHGENLTTEVMEIPLAEDDPARALYRQTNMFVGRTQPDPTRQPTGEETPVTFVNEVTHWWDGSQIYGSDKAAQDRLRSGKGGKLKVADDGTLPRDAKGIEATGFTRNWWVGLAMFHNLFVLEHNSICETLKAANPEWDDNKLFNVARLVNAAVMAKIHSIEWTPAILPNPILTLGLNANWYGILTYKFRSPEHRRTVATYNVTNPELGGLVGNAIQKHGVIYGLTEEFVEIYRLHSLLPETLKLRSMKPGQDEEDLPFVAGRQAGSGKLTDRIGMADLWYSFGNQHPGQLVLNNYPKFMRELSVPGNPLFDMGAVDILRARERGVPRYNEFRRQLGLNPISDFADLTDDPETLANLREVYDNDVEALDLLVGTLGEDTRPYGFGFGETMFQIFILNASRRLQADRFFTDDYREEVYTAEGLQWVDNASLKSVLIRHYPELKDTGLANVKNAFEPWDTDPVLDPVRHPLREWDRDLAKDPWLGDAARAQGHPDAQSD